MGASAASPALTGVQKCAILLVVLGDQISGELLKRLSEEEVQLVTAAVANLPAVSQERVEAVMGSRSFAPGPEAPCSSGHGGVDYAKRILTAAFGAEGSKKHMPERLPKQTGNASNAASQDLQRLDPQLSGALLVRSEHPRRRSALILSASISSPAQSAAVLGFDQSRDLRADCGSALDCPARPDFSSRFVIVARFQP